MRLLIAIGVVVALVAVLFGLVVVAAGVMLALRLRSEAAEDATVAPAALPKPGEQDPGGQAAMLLRLAASGTMAVDKAREMWPAGASPEARAVLDWLRPGIWGDGRDPAIDAAVERVAEDLAHGRPVTVPPLPPLPGWLAKAPLKAPGPDDRDANALVARLVVCLMLADRARAEMAPREKGEKIVETCRRVTAELGIEGALSAAERDIVYAGLGDLKPEARITALWRTECVPVLAWAVGMIDAVPAPAERFDASKLRIQPTSQEGVAKMLASAVVKSPQEQADMLVRLGEERRKTAKALKGREGDEKLATPNSRALERYRAIAWITGYHATLEDAPSHPDS